MFHLVELGDSLVVLGNSLLPATDRKSISETADITTYLMKNHGRTVIFMLKFRMHGWGTHALNAIPNGTHLTEKSRKYAAYPWDNYAMNILYQLSYRIPMTDLLPFLYKKGAQNYTMISIVLSVCFCCNC